MSAPSREFMIRQAILNAVWSDYRASLAWHGSMRAVLCALHADRADSIPGNLIVAITKEFHKLAQRYEVAA